jgi:hypothetical protein
METRKVPSWIKGGLIALIPLLVIAVLYFVIEIIPDSNSFLSSGHPLYAVLIIFIFLWALAYFLLVGAPCAILYLWIPGGEILCENHSTSFMLSHTQPTMLGAIFFALVFFLIGAFIGHNTQ